MAHKREVGTTSGAVRHVARVEATMARRIGQSVGAVEIDAACRRKIVAEVDAGMLGASRDMRISASGKDTDDASRDFAVDNGLVVFTDHIKPNS